MSDEDARTPDPEWSVVDDPWPLPAWLEDPSPPGTAGDDIVFEPASSAAEGPPVEVPPVEGLPPVPVRRPPVPSRLVLLERLQSVGPEDRRRLTLLALGAMVALGMVLLLVRAVSGSEGSEPQQEANPSGSQETPAFDATAGAAIPNGVDEPVYFGPFGAESPPPGGGSSDGTASGDSEGDGSAAGGPDFPNDDGGDSSGGSGRSGGGGGGGSPAGGPATGTSGRASGAGGGTGPVPGGSATSGSDGSVHSTSNATVSRGGSPASSSSRSPGSGGSPGGGGSAPPAPTGGSTGAANSSAGASHSSTGVSNSSSNSSPGT